MTIGLRVDVDTHQGMREGVPRLLEIFREASVSASFFFSMGPDNAGRAVFNLLKPGFLAKMVHTRAPALYGWRTILSGTLLPARPIGTAFGGLIEQCQDEGHEIGVHAWDHRSWQDRLDSYSAEKVREQLDLGYQAFLRVAGRPCSFAAPAWLTRPEALLHQESYRLDYSSDCRGSEPFLPVALGQVLNTAQVPANLPTMDEAVGRSGQTAEGFFASLLDLATALEWPVFTLHTEAEGGPYATAFLRFLRDASASGVEFAPLGRLLGTRRSIGELPICEMDRGTVDGRHGEVSRQGRQRCP